MWAYVESINKLKRVYAARIEFFDIYAESLSAINFFVRGLLVFFLWDIHDYTSSIIEMFRLLSHSITSALRHAVILFERRTGEGKRPSLDQAHNVLLPKGRNGKSWLARLMPCGGKYLACRLSAICSISFERLLAKAITGVCVLVFVMSITPYYVLLRLVIACLVWIYNR